MKKIFVTGCNGQLGRAINRQYALSTEYELINTDVGELDITKVEEVLSFVREVKPWAVINCAAYTNVDKCETEPDLAYRINAVGARNLAIAAALAFSGRLKQSFPVIVLQRPDGNAHFLCYFAHSHVALGNCPVICHCGFTSFFLLWTV